MLFSYQYGNGKLFLNSTSGWRLQEMTSRNSSLSFHSRLGRWPDTCSPSSSCRFPFCAGFSCFKELTSGISSAAISPLSSFSNCALFLSSVGPPHNFSFSAARICTFNICSSPLTASSPQSPASPSPLDNRCFGFEIIIISDDSIKLYSHQQCSSSQAASSFCLFSGLRNKLQHGTNCLRIQKGLSHQEHARLSIKMETS